MSKALYLQKNTSDNFFIVKSKEKGIMITNFNDLPLIMTVQEAASILRLKRSTAYELVRQGMIPSFKIGRHIRISRIELEKLIKNNNSLREESQP